MKMQFVYEYSFRKMFASISCILFIVFALFSWVVLPVHAAGSKGWIEASVSVPEGFTENVIVCIVNVDTYEEYATRLMKVNDYESFFEVPDGTYQFDGAFLENGDYRYNTNLTNGAETFVVSSGGLATPLDLKTVFNEEIKEGTAMVPPTEPTETTQATEPEAIEGSPSGWIPVGTTQNPSNTEPTVAPTVSTVPTETLDVTEPSSEHVLSTKPSEKAPAKQPNLTEETTAVTDPVPEEVKPAQAEKKGLFKRFKAFVKGEGSKVEKEETPEAVEEEEESAGFPWWKRALFGLFATVVFIIAVFIPAYFYRRHIEEN